MAFQGSGTAQFNNSIGTNNSFQVGSSTNLGVNASISAGGSMYNADSQAKLDLAGSTVIRQVIGTSGVSSNKANTATKAHEVARSAMSSWGGGSSWDANNSNGYSTQGEWQAAYDAEYKNQYDNTYTSMRSSDSSSENTGTISGVFKTTETGAARTSGIMSDWSASASSAAKASYGSSYDSSSSNYSFESEAEWQAAYDAEYNRAYGSAAAWAARTSESEVTVNGIGSEVIIQAAETSIFNVAINPLNGSSTSEFETANGSAGLSLATSSFANQGLTNTASAFMQAFGGVDPELAAPELCGMDLCS